MRCTSRARPRGGPPKSPRMRDRRPYRISYHRTCHRTHRSQNDRSRHRAQGSISSAFLSSGFGRNKRPCDQRGNKQFLHRGFLEFITGHGTSELRRHKGDGSHPSIYIRERKVSMVTGFHGSGSEAPLTNFAISMSGFEHVLESWTRNASQEKIVRTQALHPSGSNTASFWIGRTVLAPTYLRPAPSGRMFAAIPRAAEQHRGEGLEYQAHLRSLVGKQFR